MAKFYIKFPKTRETYEFEVDLSKVTSIEDIAEQIAEQMLREYKKAPLWFKKDTPFREVDEEKFIEANKRWLYAHILAFLLEKYGT